MFLGTLASVTQPFTVDAFTSSAFLLWGLGKEEWRLSFDAEGRLEDTWKPGTRGGRRRDRALQRVASILRGEPPWDLVPYSAPNVLPRGELGALEGAAARVRMMPSFQFMAGTRPVSEREKELAAKSPRTDGEDDELRSIRETSLFQAIPDPQARWQLCAYAPNPGHRLARLAWACREDGVTVEAPEGMDGELVPLWLRLDPPHHNPLLHVFFWEVLR